MTDPATTLRSAARVLRDTAAQATPGPWEPGQRIVSGLDGAEVVNDGERGDGGAATPENADWIALLSPSVAEPLAAWLEREEGNLVISQWEWRRNRHTTEAGWEKAVERDFGHALDFATRVLEAAVRSLPTAELLPECKHGNHGKCPPCEKETP